MEWIYTVRIKRGYDDPIYFEFKNGEEAKAFAQCAVGAHVVDTYNDGEIKEFEVSMQFSLDTKVIKSEDNF